MSGGHVGKVSTGDQKPGEGPLCGSFYKDRRRCGTEKYLENYPQDLALDFRIRVKDREVPRSLGNWMAFRTPH